MSEVSLKELFHSSGVTLANIAREIGVNKSALTRWAKRKIPAERAVDIARVTGIPRHLLRPDLWSDETRTDPADAADFLDKDPDSRSPRAEGDAR